MQTQRVNRTDAEKIFLVAKNVDATTTTTGFGVRYVGGAAAEVASADGISTVKTSAPSPQFAGIAVEDIAANGYGRIQAFGFVASIAFSAEADKTVGVTGVTNSFLKPGAVAGTFTSTQVEAALTTSAYRYAQAWTTVNISGGVPFGSGFVRGL